MSSSKKVFLGVCLVLLLLAGIVLALRPELLAGDRPAGSSAPRPALTVTTARLQQQQLAERLPVDGNIVAWQEASIASESNGLTLDEVLVDVGEQVRKGQVLARFAPVSVQAGLAQARAALAEARTAHEQAQADARRADSLARGGAISRQEIEQYRAAAKTAQARLRSARAALSARQNDVRHIELRAPDDGLISARLATIGSVPGAGTELFRLIRQGRLEWQAEVGVDDLPRVRPGHAARLQLPDGQSLPLKVRAVAPSADPRSRMARVYLDVPAHPGVRAGMYLGGELLFGESPAWMLPFEALLSHDGFNHVFRLRADQRVERVRVRPGRIKAGLVEVKPFGSESLGEQDQVVIRGAGLLSAGDLVRVVEGAEGGR